MLAASLRAGIRIRAVDFVSAESCRDSAGNAPPDLDGPEGIDAIEDGANIDGWNFTHAQRNDLGLMGDELE